MTWKTIILQCYYAVGWGHLTCKIVSEMTYNVSSGTLYRTSLIFLELFKGRAHGLAQGPHEYSIPVIKTSPVYFRWRAASARIVVGVGFSPRISRQLARPDAGQWLACGTERARWIMSDDLGWHRPGLDGAHLTTF